MVVWIPGCAIHPPITPGAIVVSNGRGVFEVNEGGAPGLILRTDLVDEVLV
jgi:hypothetical protein